MTEAPVTRLAVGAATLLSRDRPGQGSLWRFRYDDEAAAGAPAPHRAALARVAQDLASRMPARVAPHLPVVSRVDRLGRAPGWSVELVGGSAPGSMLLDGASYGLPLLLAAASYLVDVGLPADLYCTGDVHPDGAVDPVDGIPEKVAALLKHVRGPIRLLVPADRAGRSNESDARAAIDAAGRADVTVMTAAKVADALGVALPLAAVLDRMEQLLLERGAADGAVRDLLRLTLRQPHLARGNWGPLAHLAARVVETSANDQTRLRAEVVRAIATRHAGLGSPAVPPLENIHADLALELVAHRVQQAADDPACSDWRVILDAAARAIGEPRTWRREETKIAGAAGRALAAWGEHERALDLLRSATVAWVDRLLEPDASYSLCEWLRVAGLLGRRDSVDEALSMASTLMRYLDEVSRAFVQLAAARALIQLGDPAAARSWLADDRIDWASVGFLLTTRRRVEARIAWGLGEHDAAEAAWRASSDDASARLERAAAVGSPSLPELVAAAASGDGTFARELARLRQVAASRGEGEAWVVWALRY